METSAAWSNAEDRNKAPKVMAFLTSPVTVETAKAAAGSTGPARPIARLVVCGIRCLGGASKAVAVTQQSASFSARAMLQVRRAAVERFECSLLVCSPQGRGGPFYVDEGQTGSDWAALWLVFDYLRAFWVENWAKFNARRPELASGM